MAMTASWIHGNSVVVEDPPNDPQVFSMTHYGWGTVVRIRPNTSFWLHIPIPTPVIVNDKRLKLIRVFLLWRVASGKGLLTGLDLWDGGRKITGPTVNGVVMRAFKSPWELRDVYLSSGDYLSIEKGRFELAMPAPSEVGFNLSFKLSAVWPDAGAGHIPDIWTKAEFHICAAGGDFVPTNPGPP